MSRATVLARGRRAAKAGMRDTGTFRRVDAANPSTTTGGRVVPNYLPTLYAGRVRVQSMQAQERTPEAAGHVFTTQDYIVSVPVGSFAPAIGDLFDCTTALNDTHLDGRQGRVTALLHKTDATAYRLAVNFREA